MSVTLILSFRKDLHKAIKKNHTRKYFLNYESLYKKMRGNRAYSGAVPSL